MEIALGVGLISLDEQSARSMGLPGAMGALITSVDQDSPAGRVGLQPGDIILGVDGEMVDAVPDLSRELAGVQAGDRKELRVIRDGQSRRVTVQFGDDTTQQVNVQPSFDCTRVASNAEKLVCNDSELAGEDVRLADVYRRLLAGYPGQSAEIMEGQRNWLRFVRDACETRTCMLRAYRERVQVLSEGGSSSVQ